MADRSSHLVTALLCKNEGSPDRYLRRVLENALSFSDTVLLLDDSSTDNTRDIAIEMGVTVSIRARGHDAWGQETAARSELWEWGVREAKGSWLLIQDADMILHGDPRPLCLSWEAGGWAWPLVDLWDSETTFRIDGPWGVGPSTPRPWLFHVGALDKGYVPQWSGRGIHSSHFPINYPLPIFATASRHWCHLSYVKRDHRVQKHAQYLAVANQLTEFERMHAASILDQ